MTLVATGRGQYAHLYNRRWRQLRDAYLRSHPLCRYCNELGYLSPATVVDHVTPHKGDRGLFYDQANWQPLCKPCHDHVKATLERTGHRPGIRPDGTPVDPLHPWNRNAPALAAAATTGGGIGVQSLELGAGQRTRS